MTPTFPDVLAGLGALLVAATLAALLAQWRWPSPEKRQVCLRVYTWWAIVAVVGVALAVGEVGAEMLTLAMAAGAFVELRHLTVGRPWRLAWLTALVAAACMHVVLLYQLGLSRAPAIDPRLVVLAVLLLIELNDVAQYLWGRLLGRHPLAPRLSPRKTVEGALGGVATTVLLAWSLRNCWGMDGAPALLLGGVVGVSGIAGDLAVSALKRGAAVKDCGTLLPGHGGLLDRIDSFLLAGPAAYYTLGLIWNYL